MANEWLDRNEYPFRSHFMDINGQQLHYIDEGSGRTLLFVHGTPSWSFDFRNVIRKLRGKYRCVAIDHIGFGLSDKPRVYDYSTTNHSATLLQLVRKLQLRDVTLVVHDFGGPIGLSAAIEAPELVKNIVVLNSWLWSSKEDPDYIRFSKMLRSPLLPFLYKYLNFSPRFVLPAAFGDRKLHPRLLKQYTKPFGSIGERMGALAFVYSLLNDQDWFETLWNSRQPIADKRVLLIWGMKDPVIGKSYLKRFAEGFRNHEIRELDGCGHFPQEERAEEVADYISGFAG